MASVPRLPVGKVDPWMVAGGQIGWSRPQGSMVGRWVGGAVM